MKTTIKVKFHAPNLFVEDADGEWIDRETTAEALATAIADAMALEFPDRPVEVGWDWGNEYEDEITATDQDEVQAVQCLINRVWSSQHFVWY